MSDAFDDDPFARAMERIEALVEALERQPASDAVEHARALLHAVLEVHGVALRALWDGILAHRDGALGAELRSDARIATLLALHGIGELDAPAPSARAAELIPVGSLVRGTGGAQS